MRALGVGKIYARRWEASACEKTVETFTPHLLSLLCQEERDPLSMPEWLEERAATGWRGRETRCTKHSTHHPESVAFLKRLLMLIPHTAKALCTHHHPFSSLAQQKKKRQHKGLPENPLHEQKRTRHTKHTKTEKTQRTNKTHKTHKNTQNREDTEDKQDTQNTYVPPPPLLWRGASPGSAPDAADLTPLSPLRRGPTDWT